jgi:predicted nucleic acid-binding protein
MSADRPGEFVDSNVFVYAHSRASAEKREKASELVDRLWVSGGGSLSIQVLQEFFVTVTRKVPQPLSIGEAAEIVEDYSRWAIHSPEARDLLAAIDLHKRFRISFWDAMVIQSARLLGCHVLWTEDLSDGQNYAGVTVRNPFVNMVMEGTEDAYARTREHSKT